MKKEVFIRFRKLLALVGFILFSGELLATTCPNAINIPTLPVTNQALVCGTTNDLSAVTVPAVCGAATNSYKGGNEALYTLTPTVSGVHTISITGVAWTSIFVYQGCPTSGGTCVGSIGNSATSKTLTPTLTAGLEYFIWFDTWPTPNSPCPGTFSITAPVLCTGTPAPGNTTGPSAACATVPFNLGLQNPTDGGGLNYQWYVSTVSNTGPWTPVGPNAPTYSATQSVQSWYYCDVTCTAGPSTGTSSVIQVNQNAPNQCVCTPVYTSGTSAGDLISAVSVSGTTLNNNVGFTAGQPSYLNYFTTFNANQTGTLQAGTTYTITVSTGEWGSQGIAVWIDFNDNGVFESSEKVGTSATVIGTGFTPGQVNATASFNISLPCNPTPGDYRMRVRGVYAVNGPVIDPCASYTWGQTHDYRVTVAPPPPCPTISNLAVSNIGSFSADINWSIGCAETAWDIHVSTDPNPPVGAPNVIGWTSTSYTASGLTPETQYYAHVRANCGGGNGESAYLTIPFTTLPVPPACASNVVLTPTPGCDNYDITLTYDAVPSASGYNIFIGTAPGVYDIANPFNAGTNTTVFLQNPALNTTYYFVVQPFNIAGGAVGCAETSITTGSNGCVCVPLYTSGTAAGDLISAVSISGTTLNNNVGFTAGQPSYLNFYNSVLPNQTASMSAGNSYTVTVSTGEWGSQGIAVWIDFNNNDVFEPSEKVGTSATVIGSGFTPGQVNATASFNITLPCNPIPGDYRMRVRGVFAVNGPVIDPCASYTWGQTHDYKVTVLPPPPCPTPSGLAVSNITFNSAEVNWTAGCAETAWQVVVTTSPTPPSSGTASAVTSFSATGLMGSTTYYAHVRANCVSNGFSSWITTSFTTPAVPPVNDQICDAVNVTSSGLTSLNTYSFLSSTINCNNSIGNTTTGSYSGVTTSCVFGTSNDVWFTFTTPACAVSGTVPFQIEMTTNNPGTLFDTKIAVYSSSDGTCNGTLTEVACNDDNGGAGNPTMCGTGGGLSSTVVMNNLLPNTTYWVLVGAFGSSVGQFELSGRALAPAHGVATTGGGTQIQLTTTNMGAGLYTYYYKQVGSTGFSTFNSATALTDTRTLSPGNSYETQIMYRCGTNTQQNQFYRTAAQTTVLASTCAQVTDMTCTSNGNGSYTLTWTQPSGVLFTNNGQLSGYILKRQVQNQAGIFTVSNPQPVCSNGTCSLTLTGLNNAAGYNFWLETRCSANTTQQGNLSSCAPAPNFGLNNDGDNNINRTVQSTFSFVNAQAGIEFVDVQMHDAYGNFGLDVPMLGDYEIFVNDNNEITWRRVDTPVDANFDFVIVPNPSSAMTAVYLNTVVENGSFTIVDAMGRTINSGAINNTDNVNIDATQLQSGVYMVVVTVGNQQLTRRLVVAK